MATSPNPWTSILRSIEKRRSYDARFFKPVCLIAAVDAALAGDIVPPIVDAAIVIERFRSYVAGVYPERAELGWRPLWHLSNDGVWEFTKEGLKIQPSDFGMARKPDSRGQLMSRMDHAAIPPDMLPFWGSRDILVVLREGLLDMLERDDATCRSMAAVLRGVSETHQDGEAVGVPSKRGHRGQGFQASTEARLAVEWHAMAIAEHLLRAEGWEVHDVSAYQSFDFLCRRGEAQLYVEVKGTIGTGEQIILTRAEVAFALEHRANMTLLVVANIELHRHDEGRIVASKGSPAMYRSWAPSPADLEPIAYVCSLNVGLPATSSREG